MFVKIEVNGDGVYFIFKYLKDEFKGLFGKKIKWNFIKFVIDKNGKLVKCFVLVI